MSFAIHELVDKPTFDALGEKSIWMLNKTALQGLYDLRKAIGKPMIVNNYGFGGTLSNRGYRSIHSKIGGKFSQHRVGNAFDINVKGIDNAEFYAYILKNYYKFGITTVEDINFTPTWVHIDFRNTQKNELLIVKP